MRFTVKTTSIAVALLTVAILFAQAWLGLSKLTTVHDATVDLTTNRLAAAEILGEIDAETNRYALRLTRYVVNTDRSRTEEIEAQLSTSVIRLADLFSRYEVRIAEDPNRDKWDAFRRIWSDYAPSVTAAIETARSGDRARAFEISEAARDDFIAATAALHAEIARNTALAENAGEEASRVHERALLDVFVFGTLTVVTGVILALFFVFGVSRPISNLTAAMRAVADDRWDAPIPATTRSDEIGEMARALVFFRDRFRENERLRAEQAELDIANLRLINQAQEAELKAMDEAREMVAELAETLDAQVEEKTRHLVDREREIVWRLSRATERRDNDTGAHIVRMGRISGILAEALGFTETDCRKIEIATQMHDIGKVGIPDEILFKPGRLTPEERRIMETHTTLGWEILKGSESRLIQLAAEVALSHHEKWDGTGYPAGLAGEAIPQVARLAAIADVFDALMAVRPYKQAWSLERALDFVRENAGTHFDPACVEAFFSRLDDVLAVLDEHADPASRVA